MCLHHQLALPLLQAVRLFLFVASGITASSVSQQIQVIDMLETDRNIV